MKRMILLAVVLLVVAASRVGAQTAEEKKATIAYLLGLQLKDGSFLPAAPGSERKEVSSLRATSAGLRALKYLGAVSRYEPECPKFVERCFDKASGGFVDRPGTDKLDVATTAVGIMAVVELKMPRKSYQAGVLKYFGEHAKNFEEIRIAAAGLESLGELPPQSVAWLEHLAKMRNEDGTYGHGDSAARNTGGAVVAVLRLGGEIKNRDNVIETLKAGQRPDGGFGNAPAKGSDLETTYRVLRAFVMLKAKPKDPVRCRQFIARCRNADGGYGVAPGQPSSVAATYFASILLHWLADK